MCPQQSFEVFVFGYGLLCANHKQIVFDLKFTEGFSFPSWLNISEKTNPPKNYPNQNLFKGRTALISADWNEWFSLGSHVSWPSSVTFELRKAVLCTDLEEEPLSVCQTLGAACWTAVLVLVPGAVIPSCKFIFFPPPLQCPGFSSVLLAALLCLTPGSEFQCYKSSKLLQH